MWRLAGVIVSTTARFVLAMMCAALLVVSWDAGAFYLFALFVSLFGALEPPLMTLPGQLALLQSVLIAFPGLVTKPARLVLGTKGSELLKNPIRHSASKRLTPLPSYSVPSTDADVVIHSVPLWKYRLFISAMPGLIGACVLAITFVVNGGAFKASMDFMLTPIGPFLGYLALFLPMALTIRAARRNITLVRIYKDGLATADGNAWSYLPWDAIATVSLERLPGIGDRIYHEDCDYHHALVLKSVAGEALSISLSQYRDKPKAILARFIRQRIRPAAISPPAAAFLSRNAEVQSKTETKAGEIESLTDMWVEAMKGHLGRTNYVPLTVGETLQSGRLAVLDYLNSGGFSTVYLAQDRNDNKVILKESSIPAGLSDQSKQKVSEMFAREARLLLTCKHERIAQVRDSFHENGREYLVLEYIEGTPLIKLARARGKLAEAVVAGWALEMGELLLYLHGLEPPIIHRDFTPDNLILHKSGHLYLIDFGAANEFLGGATGTLIGKQAYIAPEQFQGKATPQSDIYALGATLYFLLTGEEPIPLSESHPKHTNSAVSPEIDELVACCTRLSTAERIQSACEFMDRASALTKSDALTSRPQ